MNKWENKYEAYKNGGLDMEIEELRKAYDESHMNKEEYNNLVKYERIRDNLPKVENLLEYRRELEKFLNSVDDELYRRERLTEITKEAEKLDESMKKIEEEYSNVEAQLKDKNLSQKEREELNGKKLEILYRRDENNKNYAKGQEELNSFLGEDNKFSDKSDEQLKGLALETSSRISKCNMAGRNLIEGKSWDYVEHVLNDWKEQTKYTGRRKIAEEAKKAKENKELEKGQKKFTDKNINDLEDPYMLLNNYEYDEDLGEADNKLATRPKHPILTRIKNLFKNLKNKLFSREKDADNENEEKSEKEGENNKKEYSDKDLGLDKDFRTYIRDLADKGMEGLSDEEKAEKRKAAEEKLAAMRKSNREAEAAKFNGKGSFKKRDYAAQSDYRQQNNGETR